MQHNDQFERWVTIRSFVHGIVTLIAIIGWVIVGILLYMGYWS